PPTTPILQPRSLHDALPISARFEGAAAQQLCAQPRDAFGDGLYLFRRLHRARPGGHDDFRAADAHAFADVHHRAFRTEDAAGKLDRKSTRLNSSHGSISYAV